MHRTALIALVALLALPASATTAPPPADPLPGGELSSSPAAATDTAILTVDGPSRTTFTDQSIDVSMALALDHERTAARIDRYAIDEGFAGAGDDQARRELLLRAATRAAERTTAVRAEARDLRGAYANGSIGADEFVRGIARVNTQAESLRATLDRIGTYAAQVPRLPLRGRLERIDAALIGYEGPIRERTATAMTGAGPPVRVYVDAAPDGVVLAAIVEGRYIREAYRPDERDLEDGQMDLDEAVRRTAELYPAAVNASRTGGLTQSIDGSVGGRLYRIVIGIPEGSVTAYLDGGTRNVFYEIQDRQVGMIVGTPSATATANGTRLVVNRTYPGGPLRIETTDGETGEPVAATVSVADNRMVTGEDGVVWTIAPNTDRITIRADGTEGSVTVTVRTLDPTAVNE